MSDSENPPDERVDTHAEGRKLFQRAIIVYYVLAVFGVLYGLFVFRSPFGIAGGLAFAACFILASLKLCKGSEGWKSFTILFGLFLAMGALGGGLAIVEASTRNLGFVSLGVFLMSCYLVKVFAYNQKVASYMAYLRTSGNTHKFTLKDNHAGGEQASNSTELK